MDYNEQIKELHRQGLPLEKIYEIYAPIYFPEQIDDILKCVKQ